MRRQQQLRDQENQADAEEDGGEHAGSHGIADCRFCHTTRTTTWLPRTSRTTTFVFFVTNPLSLTTSATRVSPTDSSRNSAAPPGRKSVTARPTAPTTGHALPPGLA